MGPPHRQPAPGVGDANPRRGVAGVLDERLLKELEAVSQIHLAQVSAGPGGLPSRPVHQPLEMRVAPERVEGGGDLEPAWREVVVGHLQQRLRPVERPLGLAYEEVAVVDPSHSV